LQLSQIVKLIDIRFNKERGEREKKERKKERKKIIKTYRKSNDNTTGIVRKISIK
jgi:hypothetical protein